MNRLFALVIAGIVVLVVGIPWRSPLPAAAGGPPPQALSHRPVCGPPAPHAARCNADVVTDASGNPLVSPDVVYGSLGPASFHTAYGLPCMPGGPVQSVCSAPSSFGPQIIAIVDAYNDPTVENDLGVYDTRYGLPACTTANGCLSVVNENGGQTLPTTTDNNWALEASLDVQTAHEICQTCKILLVETNTSGMSDLTTGVNTAASLGATAISNSYGAKEWSTESSRDTSYNHPGVAVVASSGDSGNTVEYPAVSPYVVDVGGTTLSTNGDGSYAGETVWSGTGSGCSLYEQVGSWQTTVPDWNQTNCGTMRGSTDVSADADPNSGAAIYSTVPSSGTSGWWQVGGTSLAAPIVAGVFALGGGVPAGTIAPASLYTNLNAANSHDITSGSNGTCGTIMCQGASGYDGPTGLGSPNGDAGFGGGGGALPTPTAPPLATATATPPATAAPSATATPPSVPADYQLTAGPSALTVPLGKSGNYTVALTSLGGYNSPVTLSVSGLPAGASASFSANPVVPSGAGNSVTLQVKANNSTPGGTYTLTITGTGSDAAATTHSAQVTLVVPSFSLSLDAPSLSIQRGTSGTEQVTVTGLGGYTSPVTLGAGGLPPGVTAGFSPNPVSPGSSATLTLTVSAKAGTGTKNLTITGSGSGVPPQKLTLSLTITT